MIKITSKVQPESVLCCYTAEASEQSSKRPHAVKYSCLSSTDESLQVAEILLSENSEGTKPHTHLPIERTTVGTQECWVVLSGTLKVDVYDLDGAFVESVNLSTGNVFVTFRGGHSIKPITASRIIEIKNGPYYGAEADYKVIDVQG